MGLPNLDRTQKHLKSLKNTSNLSKFKFIIKMHGFYSSNFVDMASMMNDIMNQPEFEKMAKHFSEEMKKSFEKCQETSTGKSTEKFTEKSSEKSSEKTADKKSEQHESSAHSEQSTPKSCPMMFRQSYCRPNANKIQAKPNTVSIPLKRFSPEQVQLNMNKNGLVTITASRENTEESNRNGQRKTTILVEETCQLPGYLVDHDLLNSVQSKFHNGFLVLTFAEDPIVLEEREAEERKHAPIEIPILMEE